MEDQRTLEELESILILMARQAKSPAGSFNSVAKQEIQKALTMVARPLIAPELDPFVSIQPALGDINGRELFHYTIENMVPKMRYMTAQGEDLHHALGHTSLQDPVVCYTTLHSGAVFREIETKSPSNKKIVRFMYKKAIQNIQKEIDANNISPNVIFAIMAISCQPNYYALGLRPEERYCGAFNSPIRDLGGLPWLSLLSFAAKPVNWCIFTLTTSWSTIENAGTGVPECFQLVDLLQASLTLRSPRIPLASFYRTILERVSRSIRLPENNMDNLDVDDPHLQEVLFGLKLCSRLIKHPDGIFHPSCDPNKSLFLRYRDMIQYKLLQLCCSRQDIWTLSAAIYAYGVIFPFADPRPMRKLFRDLYSALVTSVQKEDANNNLLLWAAFMGGIGAAGSVYYDKYATLIAFYASEVALMEWDLVVILLQRFLWLDIACEAGGKDLWERACHISTEWGQDERQSHVCWSTLVKSLKPLM